MQITVRDAARLLNVSEKTIYRWIGQGNIPAYRVNEQYRFNRAELLEWATAKKISVSPEIFQEPESDGHPLPSMSQALEAGGIYYRVGGTDRETVLKSVVQLMRLPEEVDREFLYQVLLAREALGSTGIGDGIAIPHVRNPIVLHVNTAMITMCFLEQPIDFKALDGKPVHTLFSLISPTMRGHLHLLGRLAHVLRTPEFKELVLKQASRELILASARRIEEGLQAPPAAGGRE